MTYNSLIDIKNLSEDNFFRLLECADKMSKGLLPVKHHSKTVANLFYENSTRTLVSFELAAKRLGLCCTSLAMNNSSEAKGEVFLDTIQTLGAMSIDAFVIRHRQENLIIEAEKALPQYGFINAGNGMHAHPSQALLDIFTITQHVADYPKYHNLKIVIVGDVKHSRVANSFIEALKKLGVMDIRICAPSYFQPREKLEGVAIDISLARALEDADIVYNLRVQKERFDSNEQLDFDDYIDQYQLSNEKLQNIHPKAIIMHPGPINRGIEITSEVADGPRSKILKQVENGVYMRMAILDWVLTPYT